MKNWLAAANFMYLQVLVNNFANSASSGVVTTNCFVKKENTSEARSTALSEHPETICGRLYSSVKALPSAILSGQKAMSTLWPSFDNRRSTNFVTPG